MSQINSQPTASPLAGAQSPRRFTASPWVWMTLASALLGVSGVVRAWQDARFTTALSRMEDSPFPLKDLPRSLGSWRVLDGVERRLDPEVARVAGCSDHVMRTYTNTTNGVSISVLILFGPAQEVFGHRPEICYPAAGYQMTGEPLFRTVSNGSRPAAGFRSELYTRQAQHQQRLDEVYYSFRHGDRWSPDVDQFWKEFRHNPSMFKVQIQRAMLASENRQLNNPTEEFLALLVPEIERRIAAAAHQAPGKSEG